MPSMLRPRALTRRAVIASREGIFLYPTLTDFFSPTDAVSWLSLSSFSEVSGSPPSSVGVIGSSCGGVIERADGDVERVLEALTAIESLVDATVATDVDEPVRKAFAARRGRCVEIGLLFSFSFSWLLSAMRATSLSRGGRRPPPGGFTVPSRDVVSDEAMVDCGRNTQTLHLSSSQQLN